MLLRLGIDTRAAYPVWVLLTCEGGGGTAAGQLGCSEVRSFVVGNAQERQEHAFCPRPVSRAPEALRRR